MYMRINVIDKGQQWLLQLKKIKMRIDNYITLMNDVSIEITLQIPITICDGTKMKYMAIKFYNEVKRRLIANLNDINVIYIS